MRRSQATHTSTTFASPRWSAPHARSSRSSLVTTSPSASNRAVSRSASRRVDRDLSLTTPAPAHRGIESELSHPDPLGAGPAAGPRSDPSQQLDGGERFGEVVVGTEVETFGDVPLATLRAEHQDGAVESLGPGGSADLIAVEAGEHDVEDRQCVRLGDQSIQAVATVVGDVDLDRPRPRGRDGLPRRRWVHPRRRSLASRPLPDSVPLWGTGLERHPPTHRMG